MARSLLGLFGAALLYGDGMITPAISVLGAVEGLEVATPVLQPYVVPITIAILDRAVLVPAPRHRRVGKIFGPVMLVWFATLAVLGVLQIVRDPAVLAAVNPMYGGRVLRATTAGTASRARLGVPRRDRRRGALRGHGPLRDPADPARSGSRSSCRRCCSTTSDRARCCCANPAAAANPFYLLAPPVGALSAGRAGDGRRRHRVAGGDLRRVLADAAGRAAGLQPAHHRRRADAGPPAVAHPR